MKSNVLIFFLMLLFSSAGYAKIIEWSSSRFNTKSLFISMFTAFEGEYFAPNIAPWWQVALVKQTRTTGILVYELEFDSRYFTDGFVFSDNSVVNVIVNGRVVTKLLEASNNNDMDVRGFTANSLVPYLNKGSNIVLQATGINGVREWTVPDYVLMEWQTLVNADMRFPLRVAVTPIAGIDSFNGSTLTGWAYDPKNTAKELNIHFYIDGNLSSIVTPTIDRPDLPTVNSVHGFSFTIPPQQEGHHIVEAFALNTEQPGHNPSIWRHEFDAAPIPAVLPLAGIDSFDGSTVNGWVYDPKDTSKSVNIHFYINGNLASIVAPAVARPDLPTENNINGFSFTIPP